MTAQKGRFLPYLGLTFLIGFGFFTMGLMDSLYDTYIPLFLKRFLPDSSFAVGGLMAMDNLLQLILIPILAIWSDRTRTRIGRRMPFIIVMLPVSAALFCLVPTVAAWSLLAFVGLLFVFNIFKTSIRGPVVALMPDQIPGDFRSEANGVINMMGGIGLIVGTIALGRLFKTSESLPFLVAGLCIVAAVLVLAIGVREKLPDADAAAAEDNPSLIFSLKQVFRGSNASVIRILFALFLWFVAYEGIKPFLSLYMVEVLKVGKGMEALGMGVAGVSSVILAVPSGYLAHKFGRRRLIRFSLVFIAAILALVPLPALLAGRLGFSPSLVLSLFFATMFLYGAFWIGVVVNSFPMLWQMATFGTMGVYTGVYYTFSQGAAIIGPPLTGAINDYAGYPGIFFFGAACMIGAFFLMRGVSAGEAAH
ncbi:MAG: MFS transporter [Treponema sp.]|jgi:MFS family permease|nr:MFS transporter [Treponema sp.]